MSAIFRAQALRNVKDLGFTVKCIESTARDLELSPGKF